MKLTHFEVPDNISIMGIRAIIYQGNLGDILMQTVVFEFESIEDDGITLNSQHKSFATMEECFEAIRVTSKELGLDFVLPEKPQEELSHETNSL